MRNVMIDLKKEQIAQHLHDSRSHADIHTLSRSERLKHYGLHFAKYVGRIARGDADEKPREQTIIDSILICLSAANTLEIDLSKSEFDIQISFSQRDFLSNYANFAGVFCDACEKMDHLENFLPLFSESTKNLCGLILSEVNDIGLDLERSIAERRAALRQRRFYIEE